MDQVAQIREKIDIVSFIAEYVSVKKAGRNFKANCPFHGEKTPSFVISPERQIWHCFGCGKGGDIYTFLMDYERMEFPEALRMLAKRAGVALETKQASSGLSSKKERIYQVNRLAKEFYHYLLTKHAIGKKGLTYLKERGITDQMIETFQIGLAPARGTALADYLIKKKQYPAAELIEAGLVGQNSRGYYDFFRGRLMFPLIDHRDNVVGFSGRILEAESDTISKYVNTRETLVYHKGEHFFGMNVTKDAIRRENQAIIVEGEFDVISCFQHGVSNVVGVKGTALTEAQVNLLGRYVQKITFCFDGDKAGQEAIKRSLLVVEKKNLTPTVIEIPEGKDPDDSLRSNVGLFQKAVRKDIDIYDYLLTKTLASADIATPEGKKQVAEIILPVIGNIKNEIIKEHYLRKISAQLETSYESIQKELARVVKQEVRPRLTNTPKTKRPKEEIMEEYLLALILQSAHPKTVLEKAVALLSDSLSRERAYQKIIFHLLSHFESTDQFDGNVFTDLLPKELHLSYDTSFLLPLPVFSDEQKLVAEVEKTAANLRILYIHQKMKKLAEEITEKEKADNEDAVSLLKKEYSELTRLLDTA